MEAGDIPESAVRAVSKKLRHYIDVQRREEGFDRSGPKNYLGEFSSGKGLAGTFHYNSLQDQHLQHYFEQPSIRKHLEAMGVVHPGMLKSPKDEKKKRTSPFGQKANTTSTVKMENKRLLESAAKLLLGSEHFVSQGLEPNYETMVDHSSLASTAGHSATSEQRRRSSGLSPSELRSASQSRKSSVQRANYPANKYSLELDSQPPSLPHWTTSLPNSANVPSSPSNTRSQSTPNKDTGNEVHQRGHSSSVPITHCASSDCNHKMTRPSSKPRHQDIMINVNSTTPFSSHPPLNLPFAQDNMHRTCPCRLHCDGLCHQCHQPLFPPSNITHDTNAAYPPIVSTPTQATCYPEIERDVSVGHDMVKCNVGVLTISSCNASTQTAVDAETQTDLSKLSKISPNVRQSEKKKTKE